MSEMDMTETIKLKENTHKIILFTFCFLSLKKSVLKFCYEVPKLV